MLPAQPGVCRTCHQPAADYARCWPCHEAWRTHRPLRDVPVVPISLASDGQKLTNALWRYKQDIEDHLYARDLARLLNDFGLRHTRCLAQAAGVTQFDAVTWVPTSRNRPGEHPAKRLVASVSWRAADVREFLRPGGEGASHGVPRADRFLANPAARNLRVLIVDDTWTRGTNALSAALALLEVGATAVAVMVIGRWFTEGRDENTRRYMQASRLLGFDMHYCVLCESRPESRRVLAIG